MRHYTNKLKQIVPINSATLIFIGGLAIGVLVAALLIYTSPLRWLRLSDAPIREVDPAQFWKEYQQNPDHYVFLDVRTADVYNTAHAEGAISEPIANLFGDHSILPKTGKEIVLICSTGRLASIAYGYLQYQGFINLIHIKGGLQNWRTEGLPIIGNAGAIPKLD
jgi:rhodanese-related sulfurtransferase